MNGYYAQVIQVLRSAGFVLVRSGKGSHEIWGRARVHVTVPFNMPSRHTANAIMKQAGLQQRF